MADPAIAKVGDALGAQILAWPALSVFTVKVDESEDIAVEAGLDKIIRISTTAYQVDQSDEQNQTIHTATFDCEVINGTQAFGTISRANQEAVAHIVAAIASDRTLGGRVEDIQEIDVAPAGAIGKDVSAASLQIRLQFYTARDDWFTIIGVGGQTF